MASAIELSLRLATSLLEVVGPQTWLDAPLQTADALVNSIEGIQDYPKSTAISTAVQFLTNGRWAVSGFPVLNPTHRLAASLMGTTLSLDAVQYARPPFPGTFIRVPNDLVYLVDDTIQRQVPVSGILFTQDERGAWNYYAMTDQIGGSAGVSVWGRNSAAEMIKEDLPYELVSDTLKVSETDTRTGFLLRRLMFGMCLYLSDPSKLGKGRKISSKPKSSLSRRGSAGLPDFTHFEVGKEINIDVNVVKAIRAFDLEGGKSPAVQHMVSGHWKMQPYGPGMTLRRLLHIEPYWRGPEGAPVLFNRGK